MTVPMKNQAVTPQTIEDVLVKGDLSKLTAEQRTEYVGRLCDRLGITALTRPFEYLTLNGKLVLYAKRDCTDQLRKVHGVSIELVSQDYKDGTLSVHVRAHDKDGRQDEDLGVIALTDKVQGEMRANLIMKAITKAKRRVTLSICGLGFLDETEVEDIPKAAKGPPVDPETGEIIEPKSAGPVDGLPASRLAVETPAPRPQAPPSKAAEALTSIAKHSTDGAPHCIILQDPIDWIWFGQQMIEYAKQGVGESWRMANNTNLAAMEQEAPKVYARMNAAIKKLENDNP